MYHFLLVVYSNNDSILQCFQDNITFAVYVTSCDLQKSFVCEKIVQITSQVRFPIHDNTCCISEVHTYIRVFFVQCI